MELHNLVLEIKSYIGYPDLALLKKVYQYAEAAHRGKKRISGEDFIKHPLEVAFILAKMKVDLTTIIASLLHDVVEDTLIPIEDIKKEFGEEVALLVDGVTKIGRIKFMSQEENQAKNLRKMFLAMAKDIRVVLIKLADRLHNMRNLSFLSKEKQLTQAKETLEIYVPLAYKLGMFNLKWELEDLSFKFLNPQEYNNIENKVAESRKKREKKVQTAMRIVKDKLDSLGFKAEISGRSKNIYSIYQKIERRQIGFNDIYDLIAIRIIVNSVKECYEILGIIHEIWKPIPGKFVDYIAMPKPNMYQSLHTTVITPKNGPLEVQIRTLEMHNISEYGVAFDWKYKIKKDKDFEGKLSWLRQILKQQKDSEKPEDFMEILKTNLFEDEVFIFTPKGDVTFLPIDSTPVDFAYYIHTDIGDGCVGAKVNGKIVPIHHRLGNGDIVEILISKSGKGPSRDWLNFVKTSKAKNKIKQWIKEERREELILQGKKSFEYGLQKANINLSKTQKNIELSQIAEKLGKKSIDDLLASAGYGEIGIEQIISKIETQKSSKEELPEELKKISKPPLKLSEKGAGIEGMNGFLVKISRCCNPVPGDNIFGYISMGRGISIHREDCLNLKSLIKKEKSRIIKTNWNYQSAEFYQADLTIRASDKSDLLEEIIILLKKENIKLLSINTRINRYNRVEIDISLELKGLSHMKDIAKKLAFIPGVSKVIRTNKN